MSIRTLTLIKLPPSIWETSSTLQTEPTTSHRSSATLRFRNHTEISWTWTQIGTISKLKSLVETPLSYHYITTRCLSKLQGALFRIFSAFSLLSNTNNRIWSPALHTSNPLMDRHKGLKVFITASTLRALFVWNFTARMNSFVELSSGISRFFSLSVIQRPMLGQTIHSHGHSNPCISPKGTLQKVEEKTKRE